MKIRKKLLSLALAGTMAAGLLPGMTMTARAEEATTSYTLTIPSTLSVANSGWNATDGISASGTLEDGEKLTVTAVAMGTANITATANDGSGVTATCAVTVNTVVTITQSDFSYNSFTKDGVTVRATMIDPRDGNLMEGGSCGEGWGWSGSQDDTRDIDKSANDIENGIDIGIEMALKFIETYNGSKKKNAMNIVMAIHEDKNRTIQQIADVAGVSKRTAARYIKEFQDAGVLRRDGSDISGEWILS